MRESFRTIYEMSNHFFTLSNSSAPYVKLILERKDYRPEAIDQFYDNPGLGTFTYNLYDLSKVLEKIYFSFIKILLFLL